MWIKFPFSVLILATGVKAETASNVIKEKMYYFLAVSVAACFELVFGDSPELTLQGVALFALSVLQRQQCCKGQ